MIIVKLNDSANAELPIFGTIVMHVTPNASPNTNTQWIRIDTVGSPVTVHADGNGYFTNSYGGESIGSDVTLPAGSVNHLLFVPSDIEFDVKIKSKYNVSYIGGGASIYVNLRDWQYTQTSNSYFNNPKKSVGGDIKYISGLTNLTNLPFYSADVYGDVGSLKNLAAIANITLDETKVTGKVEDIGYKPSATYFGLSKTAVVGNLEDFVKVQVVGGNTDYTALRCNFYQTNVKFKGSVVSIQSDQTYLKWSTSSNVVTINLYNESLGINETTTITIN